MLNNLKVKPFKEIKIMKDNPSKYALFVSGAAISHIVAGQPFVEALPSLVLLTMTVGSWYFRPADRKITMMNK